MEIGADIPGQNRNSINDGSHPLFLQPFTSIGRTVIAWVGSLGAAAIFLVLALIRIPGRNQFSRIIQQTYYIGARSITIIMLVSLFTGMVLGLQSYHALVQFGAAGAVGSLVSLSLIMELGPVLTAIMITARAGSAITAEIGIQRISEQIDALTTMRISPVRYLISPKVAAAVISFPLLTAVFDLVGILGGYISAVMLLGLNGGIYLHSIQTYVVLSDITNGFVKAIVFAIIVATVCCYQGYFTHMRKDSHGARAVGLSTTTAVVTSCVLILVSDYVVTSLLV
ncbi:MAG: ABC transporter permease [Syntrophaceae bacterium]|nr:ABC transporter permease [Syntrophaceae bacterium]HOE78941.1 ABC transporter permease [Smithellaceae bacterium]HPL96803.1 ABC transporter permease [Smithellaceae bacterium]HQF84518.1 ABC transporter permease [Smithellaceae bacterium]HQG80900.1 ABC transporter permease [Smithellaceae bacterium]